MLHPRVHRSALQAHPDRGVLPMLSQCKEKDCDNAEHRAMHRKHLHIAVDVVRVDAVMRQH